MEENKTYHAAKIAPILEPMIAELLLKKPDNVVPFMLEYLKKAKAKKGIEHNLKDQYRR